MAMPITPQFAEQLQRQPLLPPDSWYLISAAVLCALNRADEVADLFKYALAGATSEAERQRIAVRYREALIKVIPISGMPKSIVALLALKAQTPPRLLDEPHHETVRTRDFTQTPAAEVLSRGQLFFDQVYGAKATSLMNVMDACGTPDLGASARLMYSFFQGNTSVLSAKESMFVSFTSAIATDVQDIALNHMRGAVNHGASAQEVRAVRDVAVLICERAGLRVGAGWRTRVARL